jgi:hypothetical protein
MKPHRASTFRERAGARHRSADCSRTRDVRGFSKRTSVAPRTVSTLGKTEAETRSCALA